MAENPIKKEDIIDAKGILESIASIVDAIKNQLVPAMDLIVKKTAEEKAALEKLNPAQKEDQLIIAEKAQSIQQLDAEQKKNKQTLTEIERLQKQLADSMSDSAIESERLKQKINEQRKANKDLVASENVVAGSLTDLRKRLAELKKAYADAAPNQRGGMLEGIQKLDKEVTKLEKSIGVSTRGVGKYAEGIIAAGKQLFSFGGIAGVVTLIAAKLTEAFRATVGGMDMLNVATAVTKQGFYDLLTTGTLSIEKMKEAAKAAETMNKIRAGDRRDMVEFAALNRQISKLEYEAADKTKTREERQIALNAAIAKQNELSDKKILDTKEELAAIEEVLKQQPQNESALNKQAELIAKIISLDTERFDLSKRNQSRVSAFENEEKDRIKKQHDDLMKAADEQIEINKENAKKAADARKKEQENEDKEHLDAINHYVGLTKQREEERKQIVSDASKETSFIVEDNLNVLADKQKALNNSQLSGFQLLQRNMVDVNKKAGEQMTEANKKVAEDKKKIDEQSAEDTIAIAQTRQQAISDITAEGLEFASTLLESAKQRELEAAGDNVEKREKIEKEYAKKEKAMAISKAVISTALAVLNALNTQPYLPLGPIMAATAAALGAIQIATIAATKFAEGGEVKGKLHSQGGTLIEAEKDEFIIKRKSASKYKGLLKAINDDDPMRIAQELRNNKFHTVWGGVQETLSNVSRQDPYTRLMYEEIKNKPFTYADSDGNTVIIQNNIKRVIKKR